MLRRLNAAFATRGVDRNKYDSFVTVNFARWNAREGQAAMTSSSFLRQAAKPFSALV